MADASMPPTPLQTSSPRNGFADVTFSDPFADKPLPSEPALPTVVPPQVQGGEQQASALPRDPRHRASMPLPPTASYNSLSSARLYSQLPSEMPDGTPVFAQPLREETELVAGTVEAQEEAVQQASPVPVPNSHIQSKKPMDLGSQDPQSSTTTPTNNNVSDTPMVSSTDHPHRNEARTINNPPQEPVELALTKDDSSEEIVMSSTTYPGQEWTPQ